MGAKSIEINIKPTIIKWARESSGFDIDEAAAKAKVAISMIVDWENSESAHIPMTKLEKLANLYKRSLAVFFLQNIPIETAVAMEFRKIAEEKHRKLSNKGLLILRETERAHKIAKELIKDSAVYHGFDSVKTDISDDPEKLAEKVREFFKLKGDETRGLKDSREALKFWRSLIENTGVFVFFVTARKFTVKEFRAFSIIKDNIPVIGINYKDSQNAMIFSLFHEYAHILLNKPSIYTFEDDLVNEKVEKFCNQFAGAFLLPKDALEKYKEFDNETIRSIADKYKISEYAVLTRLVNLGEIPREYYERRVHEIQDSYAKFTGKKFGIAPKPDKKCIRDKGQLFIKLVLDSYHTGKINYSEVSDYLGVKTKYIPNIERFLLHGEGK